MNLLVTGAAGFIGSHFVLRHIENFSDDKIVVLDKLTYAADKRFLDPVLDKIKFVEGDIADKNLVTEIVKENGIDTIINFAAESHVDRSISDASPFIHTNVIGTQNLAEVCRDNDVFLFHISTDEVYGDLSDDEPPKKIDDLLRPSSPYAASKAAAEMMVSAAVRTYGIKACISRCTNNFGPHQAEEKFIPTVIRHALKDEPVPIYAEGKNKRDWLYVTDHTDAIEIILKSQLSNSSESSVNIFNISADDEKENIEVAKAILDILGKPHSLLEFVEDRPGHDWRYAIDSSETKKLGWSPRVSFEEGLEDTVEWYVKRL
ncbi:dTDP-glucose 4,6-dehydratase [Candidatus Peribacteria bacterium]|jgi:dTDP-glucose 4,6-dehydratase|nr:dTDP-glucose 4,6-dehydratase [Candidatus Peribacteria bacterium]MBT4021164.1 dTDP-glucose 4,6-dehydratase [Candidatus Peribacteria bacterium]MBT4240940.1 dTDP-glucose 4,6-dehydratase [Candidatus Peribacteria bacterium]MBT4474583.1 dTDP-glucose 4,6-dehydratase [Candidatus Peribacteria bacterium]